LAVEGAGISAWEADVLVEVVNEVYFAEPEECPLQAGQMRYVCVAVSEGAGKPLQRCKQQTVVLSLLDRDDPQILAQHNAEGLRRHRIQRLTEEAREQGGLLSQEDLAQLLCCSVRTVRRDIRELRERDGIVVATRGQQKDIGPTLSHKGVAIGHWLGGCEPLEVARKINHSLHAVERYLQHFARVAFLSGKGFAPLQIALTVGISSANVKTYLEIHEATHWQSRYADRYREIALIGDRHFAAEDQKKGPASQPRRSSGARRRP
jgi:DNA-binding CsgD family transcriptional regulator